MSKQRTDPNERYLRPHERISGSGAQIGFADTTMYLLGPEDIASDHHQFGWLPTHGPSGTFDFVQNQETGLFEPYNAGASLLKPDDPLSMVLQSFPDYPDELTWADLVERIKTACQVEEARAKQRVNDLLFDGRIERCGRGRYRRRNPS